VTIVNSALLRLQENSAYETLYQKCFGSKSLCRKSRSQSHGIEFFRPSISFTPGFSQVNCAKWDIPDHPAEAGCE